MFFQEELMKQFNLWAQPLSSTQMLLANASQKAYQTNSQSLKELAEGGKNFWEKAMQSKKMEELNRAQSEWMSDLSQNMMKNAKENLSQWFDFSQQAFQMAEGQCAGQKKSCNMPQKQEDMRK